MKIKIIAQLTCIAFFVFLSCKKEDSTTTTTSTTGTTSSTSTTSTTGSTDPAIIGSTYKLTAFSFHGTGMGLDTTIDYYATLAPCNKDNLIRFNATKTITWFPGATKCNPSEPDSMPQYGIWNLTSSNTQLMTVEGGDTAQYSVVTMSSTSLVLDRSEPSDPGTSKTFRYTYTKQ